MRLNRGIAFALLMVAYGSSLPAQKVIIRGADPAYSGVPVRVTLPGNPFIPEPAFEERVICGEEGSFMVTLDPGTALTVQLETGKYQATLYIEPGGNYQVKLPPYRDRGYAERTSPFSNYIRIPMQVLDDPENVNNDIFRFDSLFYSANEALIISARFLKETDIDSMIRQLESAFENNPSPYFRDYRKYKYGVMKLNEGLTGLEEISKRYLGPVIRETDQGFMELFSAMFKDFLFYYAKTPEGRGIRTSINRILPIDSIRSVIARHPAIWNDTLVDMVLMEELSSVFYGGDYHKEAILILLDSMASKPVSPVFATYASQLRERLASLVIGHPPPEFSLTGTDGRKYSPGDFTGRYLLLMFCTPDHYGCMMEFPFLDYFLAKHSDYLEVVTVMVADSDQVVKEFMTRNGYHWKALYYDGRTDILEDYRVRAFPTAYLIGPDGNMVLSPGILPTEGFEQQLFLIMRSRGEI